MFSLWKQQFCFNCSRFINTFLMNYDTCNLSIDNNFGSILDLIGCSYKLCPYDYCRLYKIIKKNPYNDKNFKSKILH